MPIPPLLLLWLLAGQEEQKPDDPFAGLNPAPVQTPQPPRSWKESFFKENFGFRKEVMSQFTTTEAGHPASRQSLGFEVLKKFSTATETVASFNFQGRMVRRDAFNPVQNDMEGQTRPGWAFEYHNVYFDFYNLKRSSPGRVNLRVGRFYVPFGLNLQTDTHGTVLQLSNEANFGFERDWYAGLWGSINKHWNYDAYYLTGSGYHLRYKGQSGLAALRLSLANRYSSLYGVEGGFSLLTGQRLAENTPLRTERIGADARYRRPVPTGTLALTTEISAGRDAARSIFTQLHQAEYTHASRRWGAAAQYRRLEHDASLIAEFTWYFRNDIANSNLHWVKFNAERQLEGITPSRRTVFTLQYYFYR